MAASSSSSSSSARYCEPSTSSTVPQHDIFLSHSGAQKPFATALYEQLRTQYTTFFDVTDHSLPLGEDFTRHIFDAIKTCRMAVIVLSEKYLESPWPMIELCAFFEIQPPRRPKIVPLFFKIAPEDLKKDQNKEKWRTIWDGFAKKNPRIEVSKWESALRELAKCNGIRKEQSEEDHAYINKVFSRICVNLRPSITSDFSVYPGIHRMSEAVLAKFEELDKYERKVCVLGMYGLPGSGKSILCRNLCSHQFTEFGGRVFILDLPTAADAEQLLVKVKGLLEKLTNFHGKVDLSLASHLSEVLFLLERTDLSASKVFLVIDNISSRESHDFVKDFLRLRLAVGSKVLIVAHSETLLCPLLQKNGPHLGSHYVYGCMSVPYLYKEEALQILLQSGFGMGSADAYAPEASLTARQRQILEEVVNMCSAEGHHLPLVLKIMGCSLSRHKLDNVQNWNEKMKKKVGPLKEDAVMKVLGKNFKALSKNLQTLFLDLALFIVPLHHLGMDGDYRLVLSHMHGLTQEKLELEIEELQISGFLTIWGFGCRHLNLLVHDFYLEFAASIEEAYTYFWSGLSRINAQCNEAMGVARAIELRTVVLELDNSYENFEFGQEHASVKAMVLRNCQSLKVLRGMKNLTSLLCWQICNCPNLEMVDQPSAGCNLQMFEWSNQKKRGRNAELLQQEALEAKSVTKKLYCDPIREWFSRMTGSLMRIDELPIHMKNLQVLRLVNIGNRKPVHLSGCLPQLRVVQVLDPHMKQLHVCNLPNLELLMFFGDRYEHEVYDQLNEEFFNNVPVTGDDDIGVWDNYCEDKFGGDRHWIKQKSVELRPVIVAGCPKLQVMHMGCASLEKKLQVIPIGSSSSHMKELVLRSTTTGPRLFDFTAAAESLELIVLTHILGLKDLSFTCTYKNLRKLWLCECASVVQVTGLDRLPVLEELTIRDCAELEILSGLGGLAGLRRLRLEKLSANLGFQYLQHDLENMTKLEVLAFDGGGVMNEVFNVRKLTNLTRLTLHGIKYATTGVLTGLECVRRLHWLGIGLRCVPREDTTVLEGEDEGGLVGGKSTSSVHVDLSTFLGGLSHRSLCRTSELRPRDLSNLTSLKGLEYTNFENLVPESPENLESFNGVEQVGSSLRWLTYLWVGGQKNLTSLNGVECLGSLQRLWLFELENLTCLQGIEFLINLASLHVEDCPSVEEMPSLSALLKLRNLQCIRCIKLRSLRGWELLPMLTDFNCEGCESLDSHSFAEILHARNPSATFES